MSSDRIAELLSQIDSLSDSYSDDATTLSNAIEAFEARLNALKGKVRVSVSGEGKLELIFKRASNNAWGLFVDEHGDPPPRRDVKAGVTAWEQMFGVLPPVSTTTRLRMASADVKARAVQLFEPLLERMVEAHKERRKQISAASSKLNELLRNFPQPPKGDR